MDWQATMQEPIEALSEGEYEGTVVDVSTMEATHGPVVRIEFSVTDEDGEACRVSGIASHRLSENTKLGRWVAAILGRMPEVGETVTRTDLMHKSCRVTVQHKTNADGKAFANVTQVG